MQAEALKSSTLAGKNKKFAAVFLGLALFMVGLAYAAVPLYEVFCRVTGYGGTTQRVENLAVPLLDRDMKVRFSANLHRDMSWGFKPAQTSQTLKVGEKGLAFFEAYNPTSRRTTGVATFNVTPHKAGQYFAKVECFCFTEQTLEPGQRVDMPVVYFIDPAIVDDPDLDDVNEITLSYTFFERESALNEALESEERAEADKENDKLF